MSFENTKLNRKIKAAIKNMIKFKLVTDICDIQKLSTLASAIWHEAFADILCPEQIDYMIEKFQSFGAIKTAIDKDNYEYFFISDETGIAGYTGIQEADGKLFLSKLYIAKENRGRKIASKAFDFIETLARKRNLKSIWLTVNRNNAHAIEVYKSKGFSIIRTQVTDIGNGFVMDDFVFEKNL